MADNRWTETRKGPGFLAVLRCGAEGGIRTRTVLPQPAPVDGEGAYAVEGRGFAIDGAGGRPGGAPGELVLADLIRGQRGGPWRIEALLRKSKLAPSAPTRRFVTDRSRTTLVDQARSFD